MSYIVVSLMKSLKQKHVDIMYNNELQYDFSNVHGSPGTTWIFFKKQLLTDLYNQYAKYHNNSTSFSTNWFENLSGEEEYLVPIMLKLTKALILHTLDWFFQQGLINQEERKTLIQKTKINYIANNCDSFHGDFKVVIKTRSTGKKETYIKESNININGCFNIFIIENLDQTLLEMIVHELGGHMNHYLKDQDFEQFQAICRKTPKQQNNTCSNNDFVSEYAQTNAYEDYAESFTHRRLDKPATSSIIQQKYQHFTTLLP